MLIYLVLLAIGFAGILSLGAFSFAHGGGHHGHDAHGGHHSAGHAHAHGGHTHAGGHHGHGHTHVSQDNAAADGDADGDAGDLGAATALLWLMPYLSPLNWFSWCTGAGAAGALATAMRVPEPLTAGVAVVGAVVFHRGLVRPIWNFVFQFASEPAGNLDACLSHTAEAATSFNARGEGLVRIVIDGRTEDILGVLSQKDRQGPRVLKGDRLVIEEIFPRTNSCRVSRA